MNFSRFFLLIFNVLNGGGVFLGSSAQGLTPTIVQLPESRGGVSSSAGV